MPADEDYFLDRLEGAFLMNVLNGTGNVCPARVTGGFRDADKRHQPVQEPAVPGGRELIDVLVVLDTSFGPKKFYICRLCGDLYCQG